MNRFQILKQTGDYITCYKPFPPPLSMEEVLADLLKTPASITPLRGRTTEAIYLDGLSFQAPPIMPGTFINCTMTVS